MRSAQNASLAALTLSDGPIWLLFHKIYCCAVSVEKKSTWPLLTFGKSHSPGHHTVSNIVDLSIPDIMRCPENCVLVFTIFHVGTVFFLSIINAKTTEEFRVSSFSQKQSQKIWFFCQTWWSTQSRLANLLPSLIARRWVRLQTLWRLWLKALSIDEMVVHDALTVSRAQGGLPVGFLLLRYSVLFTVESLSLLYLLVISWFICSRRWCIDKLWVFHANQISMCLDPHLN